MRSKILFLTVFISLSVINAAFADASFITIEKNISQGTVTISGNLPSHEAGRDITLLVFNLEKDLADLPQDERALQKQAELVTGANGGFSLTFGIFLDETSVPGYYKVYFNADGFLAPVATEFYYATPEHIRDAVADINSAVTAALMRQKLAEYEDVLSLPSPVYDAIEKTALVQKLVEKVKTAPFPSDRPGEAQSWIRLQALVEAYNQSKASLIFGPQDQLLHPELLQLEQLDQAPKNLTVFGTYTSQMKPAGTGLVRQGMTGGACEDMEALRKRFVEQALMQGIKYYHLDGFGHVNGLLTANGAAAGLSLSAYQQLPSTAGVDAKLVSGSFTTIGQLQSLINALVRADIESRGDNGSKGAGGGPAAKVTVPAAEDAYIGPSDWTPAASEGILTDMGDAPWAAVPVTELMKKNVISTPEDGKFRPNDRITREEFVKLVVLALNIAPAEQEPAFTDVAPADWSGRYIAAAYAAGVVSGKSDRVFGRGENITRQDMAAILYRAIANGYGRLEERKESAAFSDQEQIAPYAAYPTDGNANPYMNGRIAVSAQKNPVTGIPAMIAVPVGHAPVISTDLGTTWQTVTGLPGSMVGGYWSRVMPLAADRVNGSVFYAYSGNRVYVSRNGGFSWLETGWIASSGTQIIKAAPHMEGEVWVSAGENGLYRSTDGANSFTKIEHVGNVVGFAFGKAAAGRENPTVFLYGTLGGEEGIYRSVDLGSSWTRIAHRSQLIGNRPNCIEGDRQVFGVVYIGTDGRGYYYGAPQKGGVEYKEDFNDGTAQGWTLSQHLSVTDGVLRSSRWEGQTMGILEHPVLRGSFRYSAQINNTGSANGNKASLIFQYQDEQNYLFAEFGGGENGTAALKKKVNGGRQSLAGRGPAKPCRPGSLRVSGGCDG